MGKRNKPEKAAGRIRSREPGNLLLDAPEPCDSLAARILLCIEEKERRSLRAKAAAFGAVFLGSLALAAAGLLAFGTQVSQSGFLSFASLWFSDFSAAVANWSDMVSSMVDSFPILPAAIILASVSFAIWSVGKFSQEFGLIKKLKLGN